MDTYIKMCGEAKQLQKLWKPKVGDYALCSYAKTVEIYIISKVEPDEKFGNIYYINEINGLTSATIMGNILNDDFIYLPTEERLQEIAMKLPSLQGRVMQPFWELADQFNYFIFGDETRKYASQFKSFKKFWFAFVMKEKYHKMWDGKTWVKEEELKC